MTLSTVIVDHTRWDVDDKDYGMNNDDSTDELDEMNESSNQDSSDEEDDDTMCQ